ncbi:MAG: Exocyst complex component 5 [Chaenotheca gracillima]|nr:MAG: Exocyst complex component 5 [Chaenotheca gracillima]
MEETEAYGGGVGEEGEGEQPTQQATQPIMDPRRVGGNNSGLSEQDLSDVICILHPTTPAAVKTVAHVAQVAPEHILQNEDLLRHPHLGESYEQSDLEDEEESLGQRDIALRMSSQLKDLCYGFSFGRNPQQNDIVLGHGLPSRRISAMHFRIYLKDEVIMLEDTSTNGTSVDNVPLLPPARQTRSTGQVGRRRMLNGSSIIKLFSDAKEEEIVFIVRFPSRHPHEETYISSLHAYLDRVDAEAFRRQEAGGRAAAAQGGQALLKKATRNVHEAAAGPSSQTQIPPEPTPTTPPNLFARRPTPSSRPRLPRGWTGGDKYKIIGTAGRGTFATVYKIAAYSDGEVFAAKELDKRKFIRNGVLDQKLDNEMQIMKRLRHRHIVQYIDYFEETPYMYIIMEYVPGGDLGSMIHHQGFIPEPVVKLVARQILHALEYLHGSKITHRDIKPDNILLVSEDPIEVKLSDFGLSKVIDDKDTFLRTFCGTLLYCAPEVFTRYPDYVSGRPMKRRRSDRSNVTPHTYNQACDIWSFAAVLFMALSGAPAFIVETGDKDLMLDKIMTTKLDVGPLLRRGVSSQGTAFVQKLLNPRPELRPREPECLSDPWLEQPEQAMKMEEVEDGDDLSIIEEAAEELDASQLSLEEREHNSDDDVDLDELAGPSTRLPKRRMTANAYALREPPQIPSSPDPSYPEESIDDFDDHFGYVPDSPKQNRLFGEVRPSLVASSGVIPHDQLNLGMSSEYVSANDGISEGPSVSESQSHTYGQHYNNTFEQAAAGQLRDSRLSSIPETSNAASLLGAEVLVGQLKVASPPAQTSAVSTPRSPLTPKTPASRSTSPTAAMDPSKEAGALVREQAQTPKVAEPSTSEPRKKFNRQVSIPLPDSYYYDPFDKSTHNSEHAAKMRALDASKGQTGNADTDSRDRFLPPTAGPSAYYSASMPAGQLNRGGETRSIGADLTAAASAAGSFARPLPVHGKLTTTPGSFLNMTLALNERELSWGRGADNKVIYTNGDDIRVPKYAFDILFWKEGLPDMIKSGVNWEDVPDVPAIIKTRTSRRIWINGVALVNRDSVSNPYGRLYTGDVITIRESVGGTGELKFVCEFYRGASVQRRTEGASPFDIEHYEFGGNAGANSKGDTASRAVSLGPPHKQPNLEQAQATVKAK